MFNFVHITNTKSVLLLVVFFFFYWKSKGPAQPHSIGHKALGHGGAELSAL